MKDDVVLSTRGKKPKAKKRDKENTSKGRPGQTNKITLFSSINGSEIEKPLLSLCSKKKKRRLS